MSEPQALSALCELTYRCNLQCPYCYNPLELELYRDELDTATWIDVLQQAAAMGIVQAHFSGGEPTLRRDLPQLVKAASDAGLYTNLITQGTFLDDARLDALLEAGLAHIQVSIQAPEVELGDKIAGTLVHERKFEVLSRVKKRDVALTLNCVLHRENHDLIEDVIALAEEYGIRRLELANVQFYGWAYRNRLALMPTREQVHRAEEIVESARERLRGKMEITYVLPDYFGEFPKPCMNGWGSTFLTITPNGYVLPCPAGGSSSEYCCTFSQRIARFCAGAFGSHFSLQQCCMRRSSRGMPHTTGLISRSRCGNGCGRTIYSGRITRRSHRFELYCSWRFSG